MATTHRPPALRRGAASRLADILAAAAQYLGPPPPGVPACAGHNPDTWDAGLLPGEELRERAARHAAAIATCGDCPVTAWCAAQRRPGDPGIWAGTLHDDTDRDRRPYTRQETP
ncbi:MAG: WhiB family transcriptional regulator [Phycicoccus sp.]